MIRQGMRLVGLTGGIATGKSTVSAMLASRGAHIIDADQLARDVVIPGSEGLERIRAEFGAEVIGINGELDRQRLGNIVFKAPDKRQALNAILHPLIAEASRRAIAAHADKPQALVIYDAALIVENGLHKTMLPTLIVVTTTPEIQLARLQARDGLSEQAARQRIASQMPLADKVQAADHVIDNSGSREATQEQVERLFDALIACS